MIEFGRCTIEEWEAHQRAEWIAHALTMDFGPDRTPYAPKPCIACGWTRPEPAQAADPRVVCTAEEARAALARAGYVMHGGAHDRYLAWATSAAKTVLGDAWLVLDTP